VTGRVWASIMCGNVRKGERDTAPKVNALGAVRCAE